MKGETSKEIASAMHALRDHSIGITPSIEDGLVDTCGTGGDTIKSFNISTAAAFVASAAGCTVAKHGNRSVSSHCGSADFLESVGLDLDCPADNTIHSIEKNKIGFLYAPKFHLSPGVKICCGCKKRNRNTNNF
jgi:anthranilate phosphoribosyltransferase